MQFKEFSISHVIQTGHGTHPVSYSMATGNSFSAVEAARREATNSPLTDAEVNKSNIYTSTLPLHPYRIVFS
jgi:hypothetical protein